MNEKYQGNNLLENVELLNLLSPYSDKTLVEGCIIKAERFETEEDYEDGISTIEIVELDSTVSNVNNFEYFFFDISKLVTYGINKIYGHIGRSSIEKLLNDKGYKSMSSFYTNSNDIGILYFPDPDDFSEFEEKGSFPGKELKFYTKEELIELYETLKEL